MRENDWSKMTACSSRSMTPDEPLVVALLRLLECFLDDDDDDDDEDDDDFFERDDFLTGTASAAGSAMVLRGAVRCARAVTNVHRRWSRRWLMCERERGGSSGTTKQMKHSDSNSEVWYGTLSFIHSTQYRSSRHG